MSSSSPIELIVDDLALAPPNLADPLQLYSTVAKPISIPHKLLLLLLLNLYTVQQIDK
jgi:hypothetical protein